MTLLQSLLNSDGSMAQFDHREFGGSGQWMPAGMTMVGDMFNHGLKAKVDGLCSELSQLLVIQADATLPGEISVAVTKPGWPSAAGLRHLGHKFGQSVRTRDTGTNFGPWWPEGLGFPSGTGAQNQLRYAYFNQTHRLAVDLNGRVTV